MFLDPPLNDLRDVFEGGSILIHHVVAESNAIADISSVTQHLEDGVEVGACIVVPSLLGMWGGGGGGEQIHS